MKHHASTADVMRDVGCGASIAGRSTVAARLLDVNVLIALIDPAHIQHDHVHAWFSRVGHKGFATCPITENGLIRIVGHPKYPNSPGPPAVVLHPSLPSVR